MTLICRCGAKNRIPSLPTARVRCGNCRREFTPLELCRAVNEAPPVRVQTVPVFGDLLNSLPDNNDLDDLTIEERRAAADEMEDDL